LRAALDFLRDDAAMKFENMGAELLSDPWAARDQYIGVMLDPGHVRDEFLKRHAVRPLSTSEETRMWDLLEMQRSALLMFTSCGWFFSDVAGIETIQVIRYAARVVDLMNRLGLEPPLQKFLQIMAEAKSNRQGNGADLFLEQLKARMNTDL